MQKFKFLLLSATPYNIVDEKTGMVNKGISINYLPTDNLTPCGDTNGIGYKPAKGSVPLELMEKIKVAPAIYDFSFDMRIVGNKPQLKLVDIDYCSVATLSFSVDATTKEVTKKG